VYVLDLASNALVRWTEASAGPTGVAAVSNSQPVRYRSWNQAEGMAQASALLYQPRGVVTTDSRGKPAPLPVIVYLAGDEDAARPHFDPLLQSLVNVGGFAVVAPELRGTAQRSLDRTDLLRDIGALLLWIGTQPGLDNARVAIIGSGQRSAVALGAVALFSDRLQRAAIVDGDASGVPLLAIERPVLIARGFAPPVLNSATAEQLLWRLRAARSAAALFGPAGDAPAYVSGARQMELSRVLLDFLGDGRAAPPAQP
jgi:pimeloyl-ACP methyl ester carboxylesterase